MTFMQSVKIRVAGAVLCATLATPVALAAEQKAADVDYVALAAVLIRDGHYDRAAAALKSVDLSKDDIDRPRYFTLSGLVHLKQSDFATAKDDFVAAVAAGQEDKVVYVYLAQAYYGLQDFAQTIEAIRQAGETGEQIPSLFAMRAQSHWKLGEKAEAWSALEEGLKRFPENPIFQRQQFFYLVELGLFQKAVETGRTYLATGRATQKDYIAVGGALRKSGQLDEARRFLEQAKLRFPGTEDVIIELAHVYLDLDEVNAAADLFAQAAIYNPKLTTEASELYRRAQRLYRALALNASINDQKKKLKQRLAILLEFESYESAAAMGGALYRVGLLDDEDIRYALAYSLFKTGNFTAAEAHLKQLKRADLFSKALALRKAMEGCKDEKWTCI